VISILTDPVPVGSYWLPESSRKVGRLIRDMFLPPLYNYGPYRGHYAVTRSLVEGLKKCGLPFTYNPARRRDLADTVVVLAGVRTLRQAIYWKKRGLIRRLFAGPNIVVFSSDHESLLASPQIDAAITPSQQVVDLYVEDCPSLAGRCFAWPAGVDTDFWCPSPDVQRKSVLIFEKQNKGTVGPVEPYAEFLQKNGYNIKNIKYGRFKHRDYLDALRCSCLMIGFVMDESQGIAWTEAWSTDVPTLLWRNERTTFRGRVYRGSTAPYLTSENGMFFEDFVDFRRVFASWKANPTRFFPRAWVLKNMSDEVCARRLYQLVTQC